MMGRERGHARIDMIYSRTQGSETGSGVGWKALTTLLVMYVITGLLLFLMAFLLYRFQLGETFVSLGVILVYVISSLVGGVVLAQRLRRPSALLGLLLGTIYFFVLAAGSILLNRSLPQEILQMLAVWILCGCSGALGGMLCRGSKEERGLPRR